MEGIRQIRLKSKDSADIAAAHFPLLDVKKKEAVSKVTLRRFFFSYTHEPSLLNDLNNQSAS